MAQFYKVLKADPLGEPWESHGKQNQTFWCQVEGEDLAVSISKQVPNTLSPGQHVYGDLMKATSQKGTQYWKLKSSQVPEGVTRPVDSVVQATPVDMGATQPDWFKPWGNLLTEVHKMLKDLHGSETTHVEQIPLDKDTLEKIDSMFKQEAEPVEIEEEEPEPEV